MSTATIRLDDLGEVMSSYAAAAAELLAANGRPVNRVVDVAPGIAPAWDDVCSNLYGRVVQLQPIVDERARAGTIPCGVSFYVVTIGIAVTRCVATIEEKGNRLRLPSAEKVVADGLAMVDDIVDLDKVARCDPRTRSVIGVQPLAESGGAAGVEVVFTLRATPCCPPEA